MTVQIHAHCRLAARHDPALSVRRRPRRGSRRRASTGSARSGNVAREEGASFVVVAGDVFESNQLEPRTVRRTIEALRDVPVPIYLLPGNHDPLDASTIYRSPTFVEHKPERCDRARRFLVAGQVAPGVEVGGRTVAVEAGREKDLLRGRYSRAPGRPTLRLASCRPRSVPRDPLGWREPRGNRPRTSWRQRSRKERIAYLALGDRHSTTTSGLTAGADLVLRDSGADGARRIRCRKCPCRGNRRRPRIKGPNRGGSEPGRSSKRRSNSNSEAGGQRLAKWLDACPAKDRSAVRLKLYGHDLALDGCSAPGAPR